MIEHPSAAEYELAHGGVPATPLEAPSGDHSPAFGVPTAKVDVERAKAEQSATVPVHDDAGGGLGSLATPEGAPSLQDASPRLGGAKGVLAGS